MAFRECPVHRVAMELRQFEGFTAFCCPMPDCPKMKPNKWEGRLVTTQGRKASQHRGARRNDSTLQIARPGARGDVDSRSPCCRAEFIFERRGARCSDCFKLYRNIERQLTLPLGLFDQHRDE